MLASNSASMLSDDLEKESQKVRSMYETGSDFDWQDGKFSTVPSQPHIEEEEDEQPASVSFVLLVSIKLTDSG